jgi:hypothetical protein
MDRLGSTCFSGGLEKFEKCRPRPAFNAGPRSRSQKFCPRPLWRPYPSASSFRRNAGHDGDCAGRNRRLRRWANVARAQMEAAPALFGRWPENRRRAARCRAAHKDSRKARPAARFLSAHLARERLTHATMRGSLEGQWPDAGCCGRGDQSVRPKACGASPRSATPINLNRERLARHTVPCIGGWSAYCPTAWLPCRCLRAA